MKNDALQTAVDPKSRGIGAGLAGMKASAGAYLGVAALAASYLWFYAADLPELANDWFNYYGPFSYCAAIPLMALYVVWKKRGELAKIPVEPAALGAVFLLGAVAVGLIGKAVGDSFTVRVSMVLSAAASVYLLLGRRLFRALLFPVSFLFLMIPWPYVLVKEVAYQLRIIDAVLAEVALRALGVLVYRDSYFLHLPNITLEVADLCSGISSVFALFALGCYYAYFLPLRTSMKLLVVSSTVPFAVFINLVRIILTSALTYYVGPIALNYLVHELTGIITFFIALGLFIALSELLLRRAGKFKPTNAPAVDDRTETESVHAEEIGRSVTAGHRSLAAFSAACVVLLAGVFLSGRLEGSRPMALSGDLEALPLQIGSYRRVESGWGEPYQDSNAEMVLSSYYSNGPREAFEVFIGYRSYQQGDKRLRSPKLTMVGSWNFIAVNSARIAAAPADAIHGTWMTLQNASARQLVLYWYQDGRETIGSEVAYRIHQAKRRILHRRTDGAVIRIATPIADGEDMEQARERLGKFAAQLYSELVKVLPR